MVERTYDAVIVGGRCAGAALATYLARAGASVIVLEADPLGTDQVISTHTIHPAGVDILDELGVGSAVLAESPPARVIRFQVDEAYADIEPPEGRVECCPRRYRLDRLLQEAAVEAGAEVHGRTRVKGLLWEGERVVGVRARQADREVEFRGTVTVGADGRRSTVARLVGAEEYLGYDAPRAMYWAYWDPPSAWDGPAYPYDVLLRFSGTDRRVIFTTDKGQLLIATLPLVDVALQWRSDAKSRYLDDLCLDSDIKLLATEGRMVSKVLGTVRERYFFRRSAGPGWALAGDAGHHKDPILGWGISEALVQAKELSETIQDGRDNALERYWRQRDVEALPRFRVAEERAAPRITPVFPVVLSKIGRKPEMARRLFRETEYDVNPYDLLSVSEVGLCVLGAVLRGRLGLIRDFIAQGRRVSAVTAELKERQRLLDAIGKN
jgi:menaquinone-9 beta-reductase